MSPSSDEASGNAGAPEGAPVGKVRELISQIKSHEAIRPHDDEVAGHVAAVEAELDRDEPHPSRLASLLGGFQTLSVEASEALINSGAMTLLNEILGTGVPPVGPGRSDRKR